ncbi:MAG: SGNH/GDSL hydrolase family protein, partial [Myxococcota bacterium]
YTDIPSAAGQTLQSTLKDFCLQRVRRNNTNNRVHKIGITKDLSVASTVPIVYHDQQLALPKGQINRMVVFGDSLSDTGRLQKKLGLVGFLSSPYWLGRFSDGPNWTDYIAGRLSLPILNFAKGGAVAAKVNDARVKNIKSYIQLGGQLIVSGSIDEQVDKYISRLDRASLIGKKTVKNPNETLYVVWIGGNDNISKMGLKDLLKQFIEKEDQQGGWRWTANRTVSIIKDQVNKLLESGAKNFLIMGLPDLGKTPSVLHNGEQFSGNSDSSIASIVRISETYSKASQRHNELLKQFVEALRRSNQGIHVAYLDVDEKFTDMVDDVSNNGSRIYGTTLKFAEEVDGKQRVDGKNVLDLQIGTPCYTGGYTGKKNFDRSLCENRIYFDYVHPTQIVHCWVAYFAHQALEQSGIRTRDPLEAQQQRKAYCLTRERDCRQTLPDDNFLISTCPIQ